MGTHHKIRRLPSRGCSGNHAAAAEFDVVGMAAEGQQGGSSGRGFDIGFIGPLDGVADDIGDLGRVSFRR